MITSPKNYIAASFIARAIEKELLSRLDFIALKPLVILDIGTGPGFSAEKLNQRYPLAKVYGIDQSRSMLEYAKMTLSDEIQWLQTDGGDLPFKNQSVDLIFSNLLLPFCADSKKLLSEWRRVLRPEGLLMFTSLGPDTLCEIGTDTLHLIDLHVLGDMMMEVGFLHPVLDVDRMKVQYRNQEKLRYELEITEMVSPDIMLPHFVEIPLLTYEIVYAHAWGAAQTFKADEEGVVKIPLTFLKPPQL